MESILGVYVSYKKKLIYRFFKNWLQEIDLKYGIDNYLCLMPLYISVLLRGRISGQSYRNKQRILEITILREIKSMFRKGGVTRFLLGSLNFYKEGHMN